jgi:hypothetical protein
MVTLLWFLLRLLASPFKSASRREAENAVLRHQLAVLQRKLGGRVQFTNGDRLFFIQLYRWFPSILNAIIWRTNRLPSASHARAAWIFADLAHLASSVEERACGGERRTPASSGSAAAQG